MFFYIRSYLKDPSFFVRVFSIKKHQKIRQIVTYNLDFITNLKRKHQKILNKLEKVPSNSFSYAYKKNTCCKDALKNHLHSQLFIKIDIKNFFESISYEEFINQNETLLKENKIKLNHLKLCFYENHLPLGYITSPKISDIYMYYFDCLMEKYMNDHPYLCYSRYCDDILISTPLQDMNYLQDFYDYIKLQLEEINLKINEDKVRKVNLNEANSITFLGLNLCKNGQHSYINLSKKMILKPLNDQKKIISLKQDLQETSILFKQTTDQTQKNTLQIKINKLNYFISKYQMSKESMVAYIKNNSENAYQRFLKKYKNLFAEDYKK